MRNFKKAIFLILLILITVISFVPFYLIFSMSTHTTQEIYRGELLTFGTSLKQNLDTIFGGGFLTYYWNSFYTALLSAIISVFVSAMIAYGLTMYQFRGRKTLSAFIEICMMIPGQISLIGYTMEMRQMHMINTHWPLILTWTASAYSAFFIMQFMKTSLPKDLIESARIDGCNEFKGFIEVAFPLIKPAVITLFMLIFLWSWNNFLMPSTVLTESTKFTVPLGIQTLATAYTQDWGARGAALAISVIPILILFSIGSKYFIKGLAAGAVKG